LLPSDFSVSCVSLYLAPFILLTYGIGNSRVVAFDHSLDVKVFNKFDFSAVVHMKTVLHDYKHYMGVYCLSLVMGKFLMSPQNTANK